MADRIPIAVGLADRPSAPAAPLGPVHHHPIWLGDHLPRAAGMAGLAALLASRALLRPLLATLTRIPRWRQRTVARVTPNQPLQLLDLSLQRRDPLRLRGKQSPDSVSPGIESDINNISRHECKVPCTTQESFIAARRPPERLRRESRPQGEGAQVAGHRRAARYA